VLIEGAADGVAVTGALEGDAVDKDVVDGSASVSASKAALEVAAVTGALEGDVVGTEVIDGSASVSAIWGKVVGTSVGEFELKFPGEGLAVKSKHSSKKYKSLFPKATNGEVSGMSALQKFHTSPPATFEQSTL
jgi:hypothetical protein